MSFDYRLHVFRSPEFYGVVDNAIKFLLQTPKHPLPPLEPFIGSGVYALYYVGNYALYAKIATMNRTGYIQPIYVGKAVPPGWRAARTKGSETPDIYRRLREHAKSLQQVGLGTDDFYCQFIILSGTEGDLVVPVEAELIRRFRPLWNTVVDGFGNHDPGKGRYNQARSEWDVLHPGRPWAKRLTGASPRLDDIVAKVRQALDELVFP